jgi:hypothetical protein
MASRGNEIDEAQVTSLSALFLEEAGISMAMLASLARTRRSSRWPSSCFRSVSGRCESADGVVVSDGGTTERAGRADGLYSQFLYFIDEIFADEDGLARAKNIFGDVITGGPRAFGHANGVDHFQFEAYGIAERIKGSEIEILHVEQARNSSQILRRSSRFKVELRSASDFIQDVKLFRTPRSLLNQITIFDSHADLVTESEEEAQLRRGKTAIVGRARRSRPKA